MRKIYFVLVVSFLVMSVSTNAQTEKKEPPPPPPPKVVKAKPPVIVDEKINKSNPEEPPVITVTGDPADKFYERNPSVEGISRKGNITTIRKKDGTTEKYYFFTDKYGDSPIPLPPPPPKPNNETIKYNVVDEKVKMPSPPSPPKKKVKA